MAGTDSMETMMRMSALQPMSQDTISTLDRAGSRGNSTIRRPVGVRPPERTQKEHNHKAAREEYKSAGNAKNEGGKSTRRVISFFSIKSLLP